jgi:hypothetical protein
MDGASTQEICYDFSPDSLRDTGIFNMAIAEFEWFDGLGSKVDVKRVELQPSRESGL